MQGHRSSSPAAEISLAGLNVVQISQSSVSGTDIDPHLSHALADEFAVPEIAVLRGGYSGEDPGLRLTLSQSTEPSIERSRAQNRVQ
jgi:hypothetical protein